MDDSGQDPSEREAYEERLQRRLTLLRRELEAGKVHFFRGLEVTESLANVRYTPDGRADLSSVDGAVRSLALAVETVHERRELLAVASLAEIQRAYFEFLELNFGAPAREMTARRLSPHCVAVALSQDPDRFAALKDALPRFLAWVEEFWANVGDVAIAHVEEMREPLKAVFGGDLFPSSAENIAAKCGLYTDTIVLPDPFLRSRPLFERFDDRRKVYYLAKHALNLLQYKDLVCADVSPPIVIVVPDATALDTASRQHVQSLGEADARVHAGRVFGREFSSQDELLEFCGSLKTVELALAAVRDPGRVLFDAAWTGTLAEQLHRALREPSTVILGPTSVGMMLANSAVGRMGVSNELLVKARRLGGVPLIDAPTSWQYFVWKLEYDASRALAGSNLANLHVVHGLQALARGEMRWLGNIPNEALLELRKQDALAEVRSILGSGVSALAEASPDDFRQTSVRVFENIQAAFGEHQRRIDALTRKKWKFAGSDIGSWLVVGSLAAAATATGSVALGLAALAADQLLDAPKLRDLPESVRSLLGQGDQLKRSPVGMLFKLSQP